MIGKDCCIRTGHFFSCLATDISISGIVVGGFSVTTGIFMSIFSPFDTTDASSSGSLSFEGRNVIYCSTVLMGISSLALVAAVSFNHYFSKKLNRQSIMDVIVWSCRTNCCHRHYIVDESQPLL